MERQIRRSSEKCVVKKLRVMFLGLWDHAQTQLYELTCQMNTAPSPCSWRLKINMEWELPEMLSPHMFLLLGEKYSVLTYA